jgi:branched-chain amino acid transport system ATP-binding protein
MATNQGVEFLRITDLHSFYGESHILHGVDLTVNKGEVVTLLGRNGAGRTTTLKSIMGLVGRRTGSIMINGREAIGMATHDIARLGIGYCPEERGIFASLTCEENLLLPPQIASGGMSLDEIYTMFPNLKERRNSQGTRLSGGEQQMLAVARILRTGAKLLLLDEISEGLAPVIVQALARMIRMLREKGLHRRDGRTEFPVRSAAGGPVLRDGARSYRRRLCRRRAPGEDGHAARVPRRLSPRLPFGSMVGIKET